MYVCVYVMAFGWPIITDRSRGRCRESGIPLPPPPHAWKIKSGFRNTSTDPPRERVQLLLKGSFYIPL